MRRLALLLLLLASPQVSSGQDTSPASAAPTFEAASVKENRSGELEGSEGFRPGGYVARNVPLRLLVVRAYGIRQGQLIGGPSWIASDRFDINARAPSGAPPNDVPRMLQALLADRFKLRLKREVRDQPVYVLVVERPDGRLGPKLTRSGTACVADVLANPCSIGGRFMTSGGDLRGVGQPLMQLATQLAKAVSRDVFDRTGLDGTFDFELSWSSDEFVTASARSSEKDAPALFTALREQLGLQLQPSRGAVETLTIESVARPVPD
jgi:uncharacterized protein (TIGR03435 family)